MQEKKNIEIGKELHDNINQLLVTVKLMIETALSSPEMREECLHKSKDIITKAIDDVRDLSHSLIPASYKELNLEGALQEIKSQVWLGGRLSMELILPDNKTLEELSNELKFSLYRIIQEQVSNTLKHSKATTLVIKIECKIKYVYLTMEDNGIGIDFNDGCKGIGLRNIQSRVSSLKGDTAICTAPNKGFKLLAKIPINASIDC